MLRHNGFTRGFLLPSLLLVALLAPLAAQDDGKKADPKKAKVEKKEPVLEDCLTRAARLAKKQDAHWLQSSTRHNAGGDTLVAFFEYTNGDLGIFEGDEDPANDRFIVVDRDNAETLERCAGRAKNLTR
jgi:hypothetical protein